MSLLQTIGRAVLGLSVGLLLTTAALSWDLKAGDQRIKGPELKTLLVGKTIKLDFGGGAGGTLKYKANGKYTFVSSFKLSGDYQIKPDGTVCTTQDGRSTTPNCSEIWVRNGGKILKIFGDLERDEATIK